MARSAMITSNICSNEPGASRCLERCVLSAVIPQAELPAWYAQTDVLANPSFSESFGMSLVEGMATGLPVVATRAGGMQEIVQNGQTGFLEQPGDVDGIAAALLDCLDSAERRDALGSAGKQRAA